MPILIIAIIIIIILVVRAKNKEKERQENQRRDDAERIKREYSKGYDEWRRRKNPYSVYVSTSYPQYNDYEEILANKKEIVRLNNEIVSKNIAAARKDESFEREQEDYADQCYALSKKYLDGFGRYHYDVEWKKKKSTGGWSKEKFKVWQFFASGACFSQDLDYTNRDCEKSNADNLPYFKNKTRYWNNTVYDKLNEFVSSVARLSSRPLIVVLVDRKEDWEQDAIDFHFKNINRNIDNVVYVPLSQIQTVIDKSNQQTERVMVVDVFTKNNQLKRICEEIETSMEHSRATISFFSFLKCYEKEEMVLVLKEAEEEAKKKMMNTQAFLIKLKNPNGLESWKLAMELRGHKLGSDIPAQMIIDAKEEIAKLEKLFWEKKPEIIKRVQEVVSSWEHLTIDFGYKYLLRYYPTKCEFEASDEEWEDRYRVWNFKYDPEKVSKEEHEEAVSWVVDNIKKVLVEQFGKEALRYLTLVCIPASNKSATERRYQEFSDQLCTATGMKNAYPHIKVVQDSLPKHLGGDGHPVIDYDKDFFVNKTVILFDDVITKGNSMLRMKKKVEECGATVIAGLSIGKTFHTRPVDSKGVQTDDNPSDLPF